MHYPYQIVAFFDRQPKEGEFVYQGANGWYPQVALKRRFAFEGIIEKDGLAMIHDFCRLQAPFAIHFGERLKPENMPVEVIEVSPRDAVAAFHQAFIRYMGDAIKSKYPEREDHNYYPHMTVTWAGATVVEAGVFEGQTHHVSHVWLLKDAGDQGDSQTYRTYKLGNNE